MKVPFNESDFNLLYSVILPGYTWRNGLKYTGINLQKLYDKDLILLLENNIRGGLGSIMGDTYVKPDENKMILYLDINNLYGHSMSQPLIYDKTKYDRNLKIEEMLN